MNAVLQNMTDALDSGAIGLEQFIKVILAKNTTDADAYAAYAVVTAWLAKNDPDKYRTVLDILRPIMQAQHASVMIKESAAEQDDITTERSYE